jgi:hypothetical protein
MALARSTPVGRDVTRRTPTGTGTSTTQQVTAEKAFWASQGEGPLVAEVSRWLRTRRRFASVASVEELAEGSTPCSREELFQYRCEDLRTHTMSLAGESAKLRIGNGLADRPCRIAHRR